MALGTSLKDKDGAEKVDPNLYQSAVGSLIYLTNTRPDITHSIGVVSRYINEPSKLHFSAVKRILRYLQRTKKIGLHYKKEDNLNLIGFTDSDH